MEKSQSIWIRFFGVPFRVRTYLNLLFLLLAFPLGLIYFCFFVIGVSLGLATAILLIGFFILAFVGLGWWAFAVFERYQAIWLLGMDIPPMDKPSPKPDGVWNRVVDLLTNPVTWKSLVYLIIKLPLGIFTFIILVTLAGVSIGLIAAPFVYWWLPYGVNVNGPMGWQVDTLWEALIAFIVGVVFGFFSLHVLNYLAYVSGLFAQIMLGNRRAELASAPASALAAAAAVTPMAAPPEVSVLVGAQEVVQPAEVLSSESSAEVEPVVESTVVTARLDPTAVEPSADVPHTPVENGDANSEPGGTKDED